ncbi:MAG: phosphatidylserine decarboxylase [candidate division BRC1 bacterium ADurb.BinA364]|nr:MAG: phosphatidylserine decarboxylase [candidate division BRC1 bacterium ADurb.BinA364]
MARMRMVERPADYAPFPPLAREGWPFVLACAAAAATAFAMDWQAAGWILLAAGAFCLYFFRDPRRQAFYSANVAISPADGKVVCIDEVDHPGFSGGRAKRVAIFLSVFDVHVNRSPAEGRVSLTRYRPGRFHNAMFDKSSEENECNSILIETQWGNIEVKQIAGAIARRIACYCRAGDMLGRGQRIGLIRFGSRTEAYLPLETEIWVKKGDRVRGGVSPLGRMDGRTTAS